MIYDGSSSTPFHGDVAIRGDMIVDVGIIREVRDADTIDATGLAVAPGFINMLSWAGESLIEDGRSQSDIRQGVTLEVMGEGFSMGPLNDAMKRAKTRGILSNEHIQFDIEWTTLGEFLTFLERRGVSTNVASFVGTSTLRINVMGYEDRSPTPLELNRMRELVRQAMEEGAVGLSAALIYPPASYAKTDELIALAREAAQYGGLYISHIRSEGTTFLEALEEFITIAREAGVRAEVYHLKAAGPAHWHKLDAAIKRIEAARADGLAITANMYPYTAAGTRLSAVIPPWAHEGGEDAMLARFRDPSSRERIKHDMSVRSNDWENMWVEAESPQNILLAGFSTEALKPLIGMTVSDIASLRGTSPEDTVMDLLFEDGARIFAMYFLMSEANIRRQIALPWLSFCSDAESLTPEGVFLKSNPHPRAYGSFARVLGHYVREEKVSSLEKAIHRLTALPAANLRIERRGLLKPGYYADVVVFDASRIGDHATFDQPHQYATGVEHVFVNGVQVLRGGEHTGAKPGRVIRGPGWKQHLL